MNTEVRSPTNGGLRSEDAQAEACRLVGKWIWAQSICCPEQRVQALAIWKLEMLAHAGNHKEVYRDHGTN